MRYNTCHVIPILNYGNSYANSLFDQLAHFANWTKGHSCTLRPFQRWRITCHKAFYYLLKCFDAEHKKHFESFRHRNLCILQWRHNGRDSVSNHQHHDCLLNRLFRRISKKTSKLRVTGLCAGNSPGPVNSPHKWPVTRKMFPFDDVIMQRICLTGPRSGMLTTTWDPFH